MKKELLERKKEINTIYEEISKIIFSKVKVEEKQNTTAENNE